MKGWHPFTNTLHDTSDRMKQPLFSICIPNYNYARYIGQTIQSILDQEFGDFEILIADNKSTDNSWEVIQRYLAQDARIQAWQNPANLGFAGNLDAVSARAKGRYHLLVSSDDLMNQGALTFYANFLERVGTQRVVFSSTCDRIDSEGKNCGSDPPKQKIWRVEDLDSTLSKQTGVKVYKVPSGELLRRCLQSFYGPFNFVSTCYAAEDYFSVGGYGGSRMYNPDKWLHWRLLARTDNAYFIDKPLFSYRWHQSNQAAQEKASGALKYAVDEYRNSFEVDKKMLDGTGLTTDDVKRLFVYNVIQKNTFGFIKQRQITMARRMFYLGKAAYPNEMRKSFISWVLGLLLRTGKVGSLLVDPFKNNFAKGGN